MKKFLIFLIVASVLPMQNIKAQTTSLSSNNEGNSVLAKLHMRIDNPNANFRKYISPDQNDSYTIRGYTSGNISDPNSYKGMLIPHLDINIFGDKLAYASAAAQGLPTTPSFKSSLLISKNVITIKLSDNDIYLDSEFDPKTGAAIKPKDPFSILWQCTSGQHTYDLPIILEGYFYLNCKASYVCSHSSKVLPRTGRSAMDDELLENSNAGEKILPNGQRIKTGSYDAYPPVNFNHTQTVTYSLTQMAQSLGCSTQELAALMVYHGIKIIPLNKDKLSFWKLSDTEKDILSYCLYKLFNLNDAIIMATVEKFNNKTASATESINKELDKLLSIQLSPDTNADELRALAKVLSEKCRNNADKSFDDLLKTNALNQFYVAQSYLTTAYALKKQYIEADRLVKETKEYLENQIRPVALLRYYMTQCYQLGQIKEFDKAVSCGGVAFDYINEISSLEKFLSMPGAKDVKDELNLTFANIITDAIAADRTGNSKARLSALNVYQAYFYSPLITVNAKQSLSACELLFYFLIDELRDSLRKKPMNQQTAYFMGRIDDRTKEFYHNYQLALEILNTTYPKLYEEAYQKSISESFGMKYMQEYMKKNFYRTPEEDAFDKKMLNTKYSGTIQMIPIKNAK